MVFIRGKAFENIYKMSVILPGLNMLTDWGMNNMVSLL